MWRTVGSPNLRVEEDVIHCAADQRRSTAPLRPECAITAIRGRFEREEGTMACDASCGVRRPAIEDVGRRHRGLDVPSRTPCVERLKETDLIERIGFAQRSVKAVNFDAEPRFRRARKARAGLSSHDPFGIPLPPAQGLASRSASARPEFAVLSGEGGNGKGRDEPLPPVGMDYGDGRLEKELPRWITEGPAMIHQESGQCFPAMCASSVTPAGDHNRERAQMSSNTIARSSGRHPSRVFARRGIHRLSTASHRCRIQHCPHNSKGSPVRGRRMQTANGGTDD
jgi:hypothetical protein